MPLPLGTLVLVPRPGHQPGDDGEAFIPAMVIGNWYTAGRPDLDAVRLYAFQFEGAALINSIPVKDLQPVEQAVGVYPDLIRQELTDLRREVADLRSLVEDLTAPKPSGIVKREKPVHPPIATVSAE